MKKNYTNIWYSNKLDGKLSSANEIVPFILMLFEVESIIDIGCGNGIWLKCFRDHGIKNITGIDGDWIDQQILLIPNENFIRFDLSQPLKLNQKFDLAISLEVAEHLPEESSDTFIHSISQLSSIIVFSAAVPYQIGTNHLNMQWPNYWIEKFQIHGFIAYDIIRPHFWNNKNVDFFYKQNIIIFIHKDIPKYYLKKDLTKLASFNNSPLIHPEFYNHKVELVNHYKKKYEKYVNNKFISLLLSIRNIIHKPKKRIIKKQISKRYDQSS